MVQSIFRYVAESLLWMASKVGMTYNEINVIVYYLLIPLSWAVMIDWKLGKPYVSVPFLLVCGVILFVKRHSFRQWCDSVFMASVDFLNWFNRFGGNYILNSVIICVVIPILIYILLALI